MIPIAILIYVPNVEEGLDWYKKAFPSTVSKYYPESDFLSLDLNGFSLEIVQSDEKVSSGKKGTVVYWEVIDFHSEMNRLVSIGASLYRGPMNIENHQTMCQLIDPFGNLIGLRGKTK